METIDTNLKEARASFESQSPKSDLRQSWRNRAALYREQFNNAVARRLPASAARRVIKGGLMLVSTPSSLALDPRHPYLTVVET